MSDSSTKVTDSNINVTEPNTDIIEQITSSHITEQHTDSLAQPEVDAQAVEGEDTVRRSKRTRTLTEKGKELQEENSKGVHRRYRLAYEKWKCNAKLAKEWLSDEISDEELNKLIDDLQSTCTDVKTTYEELRQIQAPDADVRRKVDACVAMSEFMIKRAQQLIDGDAALNEEQWPDVGSILNSSSPSLKSLYLRSEHNTHSSNHSVKRDEAVAEAAAAKEVLSVLEEQDKEVTELQRLEAESLARQQAIQNQLRKLERLEEVKKLNAAKARVKVYDELSDKSEVVSLPHDVKLPYKLQTHKASSPAFIPQQAQVQSHYHPDVQLVAQVSPKGQAQGPDLATALAEAMSANRLPTPEPTVYTGDPIKYNDWKLSFQILIDRKGIPKNEKLYYLRKYLSGAAKKAVEGLFLIGTEAAYDTAWKLLEKRFGDPFVIGKSFRDKLHAWPKVNYKDGCELRELADFLQSCEAAIPHIKTLEILNDCTESQKILSKLPDWLVSRWNRKAMEARQAKAEYPPFKELVNFLSKEADLACDPISSVQALKNTQNEKPRQTRTETIKAKTLSTNTTQNTVSCVFCKKSGHRLEKCFKFVEKTVPDRIKFVQEEKLCFGCLKTGHHSRNCEDKSKCDTCRRRHPTCLHDDNFQKSSQAKKVESDSNKARGTEQTPATATATTNRVAQGNQGSHTSSIVPVWVSSTKQPDHEILTYALLDTQSDTTFILDQVAQELNTKKENVCLRLSTMSSVSTVIPCQKLYNLHVRGYNIDKMISLPPLFSREFIPAERSHIPTSETAKKWPHLEPLVDKIPPPLDCQVGLLIGYNCHQALLPREILCGEEGHPYGQRTDLGWSIVGCSKPATEYEDAIGLSHRVIVRQVTPAAQPLSRLKEEVHFVCRNQVKELNPSEIIKALEMDFTDQSTDDNPVSQDDLLFMSRVKEGIRQKEDGHYELPLPFKKEKPSLPSNERCAVNRLAALERRLRKNEQYYNDYVLFMNDIIARGDAVKVPESELHKQPAWYIPHHGVYHPHKPGKIRVVFDCSARFQDTSLNDHLLTGPDLTNTLVGVLIRFRKGPIAIMCDIEKMFHQFHVAREHQDYLRFLWWDKGDMNSKPSVYRMRVHLFGAASSPGCSNFALKHLAAQGRGHYNEEAIRFIQRSFYVDDGLTSVSTTTEAISLIKESRALCRTGNLRLHKFVSNSKDVINSVPPTECTQVKDQDIALGEHIERALGVQWCVEADEFQFRIIVKDKPLTRRGVLSTIASVFDPLGFVAPFILLGKQILQTLCSEKVTWDEALPEHVRPRWESWLRDLPELASLKIPRSYSPEEFGKTSKYELHNFSDASCIGYGACSYLRVTSETGQVSCSLIMGKSRVAPTKLTTIPRLELSSAVTSVRSGDSIRGELEIEALPEYYWTDSKVVLGYVNNDAKRFHTFVANRIQRIKSSTDSAQWHHVSSEDNPADLASRGASAAQLKDSCWLKGPDFLWQPNLSIKEPIVEMDDADPELRKAYVHTVKVEIKNPLLSHLSKFSDWSRAVKAVARLKKYIRKRSGGQVGTGETTNLEERREAELFIIKLTQEEAFADELKKIKCNGAEKLCKRNKLYRLNAYLDVNDILRVGGRLSQSALHHDVKHPAILPRKAHVSDLIVKYHHERVHHQGRGMTMNEIRANGIWILGCGSVVSSHIYKCVPCRKYRRTTEVQQMADLPEERTLTSPPFTYCGLDCFGPFLVKEGRKELKRYGLIFTCLCSRAVHIETLDDMTTDAFINALRTLIAIRGPVRQLRCDQGTNFMGARREFAELLKGMDQERQREIGCEFIVNIPSASHMGGVWERQIRTIRSILTTMFDKWANRLDTTSLKTLMYETMAIINSRPLSVEHLHDPTAPEPLTPNHILTMKSAVILPPPGQFCKEDLYLHKRWRKVQFLANEFWQRWKREYLLNQQQRQKWHGPSRNSQVNDIVILKDECAPRNEWKLARVIEAQPGRDGKVRKLKLVLSETSVDKGKPHTRLIHLERPIHKIVTLVEAV